MKAKPKKKRKAPAKPRFVFTFEGRGYGHGVGMSQYGAYGAALAGESVEQILARYYRNTAITTLPVTPVRVLIGTGATSVRLNAAAAWTMKVEGNPLQTPALPVGADVTFTVGAGGAVVAKNAAGDQLATATGPVRLEPADNAATTIRFRNVRYRGTMRLVPSGNRLTIVNHIDLEQYLRGVVPREMPAAWGTSAPAALEAQAIAARSYAMATKKSGGLFDMYADERSQVYGGVNSEDPRTNQAVAATAGKVVTYDGRIATTFFFSTSGGMTENVENIFSPNPLPYLRSAVDRQFDAQSPHHVWRDPKTFTDAQLAKLLGVKGFVLRFKVLQRGASPRVVRIRVYNRKGAFRDLRGSEVRSRLGLRDTWFTVRRKVRTPSTLALVSHAFVMPPPGTDTLPAD